ncbi:MAG: TolC family protein, partial [Edaphobacter sp.]
MRQSERARFTRTMFAVLGIGLLCLSSQTPPALAQAESGNKSPATGPSTGPTSSPIATAQQQLYGASGSNGAQATPDSFQGSVVEGKSTGSRMDLSLDEAIQRGLRQNLGVIL